MKHNEHDEALWVIKLSIYKIRAALFLLIELRKVRPKTGRQYLSPRFRDLSELFPTQCTDSNQIWFLCIKLGTAVSSRCAVVPPSSTLSTQITYPYIQKPRWHCSRTIPCFFLPRTEKQVNLETDWFAKWRLEINSGKTVVILFSHTNFNNKSSINLNEWEYNRLSLQC